MLCVQQLRNLVVLLSGEIQEDARDTRSPAQWSPKLCPGIIGLHPEWHRTQDHFVWQALIGTATLQQAARQ